MDECADAPAARAERYGMLCACEGRFTMPRTVRAMQRIERAYDHWSVRQK